MIVLAGREGRWKYEDGGWPVEERLLNIVLPGVQSTRVLDKTRRGVNV